MNAILQHIGNTYLGLCNLQKAKEQQQNLRGDQDAEKAWAVNCSYELLLQSLKLTLIQLICDDNTDLDPEGLKRLLLAQTPLQPALNQTCLIRNRDELASFLNLLANNEISNNSVSQETRRCVMQILSERTPEYGNPIILEILERN